MIGEPLWELWVGDISPRGSSEQSLKVETKAWWPVCLFLLEPVWVICMLLATQSVLADRKTSIIHVSMLQTERFCLLNKGWWQFELLCTGCPTRHAAEWEGRRMEDSMVSDGVAGRMVGALPWERTGLCNAQVGMEFGILRKTWIGDKGLDAKQNWPTNSNKSATLRGAVK